MAGYESRMVRRIVVIFACLVSSAKTWETSCGQTKESFVINTKLMDPLQLHVRQNIQGTVVVKSAPPELDKVKIDIAWSGTEEFRQSVKANYSVLNTIEGQVIFLQLDSSLTSPVQKSTTTLIASITGGFVGLVAIFLVVWCIRRHKQRGELNVEDDTKYEDSVEGNDPSYTEQLSDEEYPMRNGLLPQSKVMAMQREFFGDQIDPFENVQGRRKQRNNQRMRSDITYDERQRGGYQHVPRDEAEGCHNNQLSPEDECHRHGDCLCDSCHSLDRLPVDHRGHNHKDQKHSPSGQKNFTKYTSQGQVLAEHVNEIKPHRGSPNSEVKQSTAKQREEVTKAPKGNISPRSKKNMSGYGYSKCDNFVPAPPPPPPIRDESLSNKAKEVQIIVPESEQPLHRSTPKVLRSPKHANSSKTDKQIQGSSSAHSSRSSLDKHKTRHRANHDSGHAGSPGSTDSTHSSNADKSGRTKKLVILPRQNTTSSSGSDKPQLNVPTTSPNTSTRSLLSNNVLERTRSLSPSNSLVRTDSQVSADSGHTIDTLDSSFDGSQSSGWSDKFGAILRRKSKEDNASKTGNGGDSPERPISAVWKPISTFVTSLLPSSPWSSPEKHSPVHNKTPSPTHSKTNGVIVRETSFDVGKTKPTASVGLRSKNVILPVKEKKQWQPLPPPKIIICDEDTLCDGFHGDHDPEVWMENNTNIANIESSNTGNQSGLPTANKAPGDIHVPSVICHHEENDPLLGVKPAILDNQNVKRTATVSSRGLHSTPRKAMLGLTILTVLSLVYAQCPGSPEIHVIVHIPESIYLGDVKVFFKRGHTGEVYTDKWKDGSSSRVQIFELDEVSQTKNTPCSTDFTCPQYGSLSLMGCDAQSQRCMCQRGYVLMNGVCDDVDECDRRTVSCYVNSHCVNNVGSYNCQCDIGYHGNQEKCQACSGPCPAGFYEVSSCNQTMDRICKACQQCIGKSYESSPCMAKSDRSCIDVSNPFNVDQVIRTSYSAVRRKQGLTVEASDNVFTEDLHSTAELESRVYVTDNNQYQQFSWQRESGLRIHIQLKNISLVPEYIDVKHHGDNKYIMSPLYPHPEEKKQFEEIMEQFCRYPVPDYYNLSLEVYHNRVSSVTSEVCDSTNPKRIRCPQGFKDGQKYYYRHINTPCKKRGVHLEKIQDSTNSLLCTQETPLLVDIFHIRMDADKMLKFPYWECPARAQRCETCLRQSGCPENSPYKNQTCCNLDCYSQGDCKGAWTEECNKTPVECAEGDTQIYTLHPMYENVTKSFLCHYQYVPLRELYVVEYQLKMPGKVSKKKSFVMNANKDKEIHSHSKLKVGFVQLEHKVNYKLEDEFMLVGDRHGKDYAFSVHPFKPRSEFKGRPVAYAYPDNILSASLQTARPFDVSSSTWRAGGCWKRSSNLYKKQRMYRQAGERVTLQKTSRFMPHKFAILSDANMPQIKVSIPGNSSVLSDTFKTDGAHLKQDSLHYQLIKNDSLWYIELQGEVTRCDTYLALIVNDKLKKSELYRLDILVHCPRGEKLKHFRIVLGVPSVPVDQQFEVVLQDSRANHTVIMTSISVNMTTSVPASSTPQMDTAPPWDYNSTIILGGGITISILILVYAVVIWTRSDPRRYNKPSLVKSRKFGIFNIQPPNEYYKQTSFIVMFILFKFMYSICFTFTIFILVFVQFNSEEISALSKLAEYQNYQANLTKSVIMDVSRHEVLERWRLDTLAQSMQMACDKHRQGVYNSTQHQMIAISNTHLSGMYENMMSIPYQSQQVLDAKLADYKKQLDQYIARYKKYTNAKLTFVFSRYEEFLQKIHKSDWLSLARKVWSTLNLTDTTDMSHNSVYLMKRDMSFMSFMGTESPIDFQAVPYNIKLRLGKIPPVPNLPKPFVNENAHMLGKSRCSKHNMENPSDAYLLRPLESLNQQQPAYPMQADTSVDNNGILTKLGLNSVTRVVMFLLIGVDVIIVIYRLLRTYKTVIQLRSNFEDRVREGKTKNPFYDACYVRCLNYGESLNTYVDYKEDGEADDSRAAIITNRSLGTPSPKRAGQKDNCTLNLSCILKTLIKLASKLLRQNYIPKIVCGCLAGLCLYSLNAFSDEFLRRRNIHDLGNLDIIVHGLAVMVNTTNIGLAARTANLNKFVLPTYRTHMYDELHTLSKAQQLFNNDQVQLVTRYNNEMCSLQTSLLHNRTCVPPLLPTVMKIDIHPCNFVNIQASLYLGFQPESYMSNIEQHLGPIVDAARTLVLKLTTAVTVVVIVMTIIQLLTQTMYMYLKTRRKLPFKTIFITTKQPVVKSPSKPIVTHKKGGKDLRVKKVPSESAV